VFTQSFEMHAAAQKLFCSIGYRLFAQLCATRKVACLGLPGNKVCLGGSRQPVRGSIDAKNELGITGVDS